MRTPIFAAALLTASSLMTRSAEAADYKVDKSHSGVHFRVSHLGFSFTHGAFGDIDGTFELGDSPEDVRFDIVIQATSVDTQNEKRDRHLRNEDFFHVDVHPEIRFVSGHVQPNEEGWLVTGELTMLDVTLPLMVQIDKVAAGKDPWGGHRAGVHAEFTIKRSDYGMSYNLDGIGDLVHIVVDIEGKRKSKD